MTDTLDNGIKLPARGSRDWYSDASSNAHLIDEHLGDTDVHLTDDDRTAISSISSKANSSDVYTKTQVDTSLNSKANTSDLTTHTSNADIHVTSTDKSTWNGKQSALSTAQLNACNSGITSTKVSGYDTHVANSDVHVTTSDKSTWNAKQNSLTDTQLSAVNSGITSDKVATYDGYATSKANDSDVIHKSGDETINGVKTFRADIRTYSQFVVLKGDYAESTTPTQTNYSYFMFQNSANTFYTSFFENRVNTNGSIQNKWTVRDINKNENSVNLTVNGSVKEFKPNTNGVTDLGTYSNKWKTINGVNPGALSLPDPSTTFIEKSLPSSGGMIYADVDGWFEIRSKSTSSSAFIQLYVAGGGCVYAQNTGDNLMISVPLRKGVGVTIFYKDITTTANTDGTKNYTCRLVPCQGNV